LQAKGIAGFVHGGMQPPNASFGNKGDMRKATPNPTREAQTPPPGD
jgi:hypothetical protein